MFQNLNLEKLEILIIIFNKFDDKKMIKKTT